MGTGFGGSYYNIRSEDSIVFSLGSVSYPQNFWACPSTYSFHQGYFRAIWSFETFSRSWYLFVRLSWLSPQ